MKQTEYMRNVYHKISRYLKPTNRTSLHKVQTTNAAGEQHEHTTKEGMESILLEHHSTHFSQAQGTPFTTPPLTTQFQHIHDSTPPEDCNTFPSQDMPKPHPDVQTFLDKLQPSPLDPPQIDTSLTISQIKQGFRIWNKNTSTSPLGRQLPLYKMCLTESGTDDGKVIAGDTFFQLILDIIKIAQQLQIPLARWTTIHNIFILKKPNDYRPQQNRC